MRPPGVADVAQHGPGLHRGELVPVPQEDESGRRRQGLHQPGHEGQRHHGGLVHHDHPVGQRVVPVVTEADRAGNHPQQPVDGGDLAGDPLRHGGHRYQALPGIADGVAEPRRGLARGRCQGNARPFLAGLLQEQGQDRNHGGGLAGTRPPGDDAKAAPHRGRGSHPLPVHGIVTLRPEDPVNARPQKRQGNGTELCGFLLYEFSN